MAIDGWTNYDDDTNYFLNDALIHEGTSSLRVNDIQANGGVYNDQTATDSPTDVAHEFYGYVDSDSDGFVLISHFDTSKDIGTDATLTAARFLEGSSGMVGRLDRRDSGSTTATEEQDFVNDPSSWTNVTLSDGANPIDRWVLYRIEIFVDNNDDIRSRIREDADSDGTWEDLLKQDLVLEGLGDDLSGELAMAVGGLFFIVDGDSMHIDTSEIYY